MKTIPEAFLGAINGGIPVLLVADVLTTNHRGRLSKLFMLAANRFLESHCMASANPSNKRMVAERMRDKLLLDLIRARLAVLGLRKLSPAKVFETMAVRSPVATMRLVA